MRLTSCRRNLYYRTVLGVWALPRREGSPRPSGRIERPAPKAERRSSGFPSPRWIADPPITPCPLYQNPLWLAIREAECQNDLRWIAYRSSQSGDGGPGYALHPGGPPLHPRRGRPRGRGGGGGAAEDRGDRGSGE